MAFVFPTLGPTSHPVSSTYYGPISQANMGNNVNAPLVGIARNATNFQPVVRLPATLQNMVSGFNPRVLFARKK
jgi:hypothetical protein